MAGKERNRAGSKRLSIRAKLLIVTAITLVTYIALVLFSIRAFGSLTKSMDEMHAIYGTLTTSAQTMHLKAYEAQVGLFGAIVQVRSGASEAVIEDNLSTIKSAVSDGRAKIVEIFDSELISEKQASARADVLEKYEAYAMPMELASDYLAAGMPPEDDILAFVGESFDALVKSLNTLSSEVGRYAEEGYAASHAEARRISLILIGAAAVGFLIITLVLLMTIRSIPKSIRKLSVFVSRVGKGDLREISGAAGKDEIGRIAESVDGLVGSLRTLVEAIRKRLEALASSDNELMANIEETSASVSQINGSIQHNAVQLKEETSAVTEVSAAVEELARGVDSLSAMIEEQGSILASSSAAVEQMIANVVSVAKTATAASDASLALSKESSGGKERIAEVANSIDAIVHSSESLSEAASVIEEIANQTTILAMNAAIEAAHAGESGKGFAVVADEIRKLADQAKEQAREIGDDLGRVADAIEGVRVSTEGVIKAFGTILDHSDPLVERMQSIGDAMSEQDTGGRQVLDEIGRLKTISSEIEKGSSEMSSGNRIILEQISRLKDIHEDVSKNEGQIASGAGEIETAARETTRLGSENAGLLQELGDALGQFIL